MSHSNCPQRGPSINMGGEPADGAQRTFAQRLAQPDQLRIKTTCAGDRITLTVRGDLDLAGTPVLERALAITLRLGPARLVLDLGGVDFIDSRGLGALLHASRRFGSAGCQVLVRRPTGQARRLFEVTGADTLLDIEQHAGATP